MQGFKVASVLYNGSMVTSASILTTKLYILPPQSKAVLRPRLLERLNERVRVSAGGTQGVTLISAPAGFGKTTLVFAPSCIDIIEGRISAVKLRGAAT